MHDTTTLRPSLRDLLTTLFRYRWTVAVIFVAVFCGGIFLTMRTPRVYEARARVFVGSDVKQLRLNQTDQVTRITLEELISTEVEIAKSLPVLDAALKAAGTDNQGHVLAIDQLMTNLTVLPVHKASLMELQLQSPDPEYAARVLDAIVAAYIERRSSRSDTDAEQERYQSILEDINGRITQTEAEFNDFIASHDITQVATQQQREIERLSGLESSRTGIETELATLRHRVERLDERQADFDPWRISSSLGGADPQLQAMLAEWIRLGNERTELVTRLQENAPEVRKLDLRLAAAREELERQFGYAVDLARHQLEAKEEELRLVHREIAGISERTRGWAAASSRQENLQQQLVDLRSVRTVLTRQLEEARIRNSDTGNLRVEPLEPARVPRSPIKPNVPFNLVASLLVALLLSIGLPFYLQTINDVLVNDLDVARATGLPVLGNVRDLK